MRDVVKTNVRRQQSTKRRRRRTRLHTTYFMLVAVLVIGIGIALSMTLFFNITDIVVINGTDVPDEEIVALSGISYQDNLVRLDAAIAAEKVRVHVAYAEKVTVRRVFPSTVEITVEKAEPVANISQSYGYLLVSASNRVLEELKGAPKEGLIIITGYNPAQGTIGMVLKSEDEKRDNVLKTLTAAVSECKNEQIVSIDMTDQSDILVQFGENVTFHMGTAADAVYKLRFAAKTIEHLTPGRKYQLTMIGNNQISEIPEDTMRKDGTAPRSANPAGTAQTTATTATTAGTAIGITTGTTAATATLPAGFPAAAPGSTSTGTDAIYAGIGGNPAAVTVQTTSKLPE